MTAGLLVESMDGGRFVDSCSINVWCCCCYFFIDSVCGRFGIDQKLKCFTCSKNPKPNPKPNPTPKPIPTPKPNPTLFLKIYCEGCEGCRRLRQNVFAAGSHSLPFILILILQTFFTPRTPRIHQNRSKKPNLDESIDLVDSHPPRFPVRPVPCQVVAHTIAIVLAPAVRVNFTVRLTPR